MTSNTTEHDCDTFEKFSISVIADVDVLKQEKRHHIGLTWPQEKIAPTDFNNGINANKTFEEIKETMNLEEAKAPDGGCGWIILIAAFFCAAINFGIIESSGLLYTMIMDTFEVSIAELSWIGSLQIGTAGIGGLIAPVLLDRLGCRLSSLLAAVVMSGGLLLSMLVDSSVYILYVTLGVMPGFALFLQLLSVQTIICSYFKRYRPLAFGLLYSSSGLGNIIIAPVLTSLYSTFGLWGTFLLMGGVTLNQIGCVLTFRPLSTGNHRVRAPSQGNGSRPYLQLLKKRKMWLLIFHSVIANMVTFYFVSFVPEAAKLQISGITLQQVSFIISIYGVASILSRVVTGVVCTIVKPRITPVYIAAGGAAGIAIAAVPYCTSYSQMIAVSALYAFSYGCFACTFPSVILELFDPKLFTYVCGLYYLVCGFSAFVGLPVGGFIISITSNFNAVFFIAAAGFVLSVLLLMPTIRFRACKKRVDNYSVTEITLEHM